MENINFEYLSEDELFDVSGGFDPASLIQGVISAGVVAGGVAGGTAASPLIIIGGCAAVGYFAIRAFM